MLAAAALMFAACAQFDTVNEVPESEPQAIGFETFANLPTKATENTNSSDYSTALETHHTAFKVWASKQLADNSYVPVYPKENPGTVSYTTAWAANPLKYWDKSASNYQFYAAAPSEITWAYNESVADDGSTGYFTLTSGYSLDGNTTDNIATRTTALTNTWLGSTGDDKDLMIAAACKVENATYNVAAPEAVGLNFIHILSKLNIAVSTTEANVVLKALDVCRLNNTSASFNENADINGDSNFDDADKTALQSGSHKRWATASGSYTLGLGDELALTKDASAVYTHEYLVMPQLQTRQDDCKGLGTAPANDAYIYIEYTLGGELYKTYYGLAEAFAYAKGSTLPFNEGWQNTLTITIQPDAIVFTGKVADWGNTNKELDIE